MLLFIDEIIVHRMLLVALSVQLPIVGMLAIIGWQVHKQVKSTLFKFLYLAWAVDLFYIAYKVFTKIIDNHDINIFNALIQSFVDLLNLKISPLTFKTHLSFGFDLLLNYITAFLLIYAIKNIRIFNKRIIYFPKWAYIFGFCFSYLFLFSLYIITGEIITDYIIISINVMILIMFYRYMRAYKLIPLHNSFFIGLIIYICLQPLSIFDNPIIHIFGYTMGGLSKCLMVYGLARIFITKATESFDNQLVAEKLNRILGRTFHEILPPITAIENSTFKLNPESRHYAK